MQNQISPLKNPLFFDKIKHLFFCALKVKFLSYFMPKNRGFLGVNCGCKQPNRVTLFDSKMKCPSFPRAFRPTTLKQSDVV